MKGRIFAVVSVFMVGSTLFAAEQAALGSKEIVSAAPAVIATNSSTKEILISASAIKNNALSRPTSEPVGLRIASSEVTAEDIFRQNPATLTDALNYSPGAWTETRGRKVKQFTSFRGQTYPYPDYAIDGMWFREFHELPYLFPAPDIERVEVIRSSAALMTGLSGLSGVINVVPKLDTERTTRTLAEYGTDNSQRYHVSHTEPIPDGSIQVSVGHQSTDGEDDMNAAERMNTGSLRLHWEPGEVVEWDTFLFFLQGAREFKIADDPANTSTKNKVEEYDPIQSVLFGTRLRIHESDFATTELSLWGANREEQYVNKVSGAKHDDDDYEYGIQLLQAVSPIENNILRFGGLYHHWVAPDGKRYYAGKRNDIETLSVVVVDEHDFGKLKMDAGYRYSREYINDYAAYGVEGSGKGLGTATPIENEWASPLHRVNLGGSYALHPAVALYANYSYGQLDAPSGAITASGASLGGEDRHMADAGLEFNANEFGTIKTGVFGIYQDNGIHITANTYVNAIGEEAPYYENRDGRQYGFEAEWRSPWYLQRLSLFASAQLMHAEAKDAQGDYQEDKEIPAQVYTGGLYLREGRFDASFFGKYVDDYENARFSSTGPQPLGDYFDLNATAGYTFGQEFKTRAYITLNNLLDDDYSTVVGYYDAGLHVTAGVQCEF
ncbi:MAG: TonB-dependent receptor plug domain-containing protein [Kiritimatiellales bacterium]|nr:TonB-dependent receptor plug domain-containing protein [Kiritimatiellales bacterium]